MESFNLQERLRFSPDQGTIVLGQTRIMIFNLHAMTAMRRVIYEQVGPAMAKMILARFGYESAVQDFKALQASVPDAKEEERLLLGPLMHAWSGIVQVEATHLRADKERGEFHFKGIWRNSYEAQAHLTAYGRSDKPVCYSLTGYGSAWCTSHFGVPMLEIETKCIACGDDHCEWEIKPWDQWGPEADPWKQSLSSTSRSIHADLERSNAEYKRLHESLEVTVDQRARENKILLCTLAHDLATPLQLAQHYVMQAVISKDTAKLAIAGKGITNAIQILKRVREGQALKDGKISVTLASCRADDIVDELLDIMRLRLSHKDIRVERSTSGATTITTDFAILRDHILGNILTNAIKFSDHGGTINISVRGEADGTIVIAMRDFGVGIPREILNKIFDPRTSTTRQGTSGEMGTGFGMPLVKRYTELLEARVQITSTPIHENPLDHGTLVEIFLPQKPV